MAQAFGRDVTMAIGLQPDFDTPAPGGAYTSVPFYTHTLTRNAKFEDDPVLGEGRGRSPAPPVDGLFEPGGDLVAPFDLGNIGLYLRALMGAPETDGMDDYTHVFKPGPDIPAHTIEIFNRAGDYSQHVGLMLDKLALDIGRDAGYRRVTASWKHKTENKLAASAAGLIAPALTADRIPAAKGSIKKDGVKIGEVVMANLSLANNLEAFAVADQAEPGGYDPGEFNFTGALTARFTSSTLYDLANSGAAFALEFGWSLSPVKSLTLRAGVVRLEKTAKPVSGPGGLQQVYNFRAEHDAAEIDKAMLVATLKNQIASYALE